MKLKPALALLVLPLTIASAYAEEGDGFPTFTFSGFGTAALTQSNSDDAEFIRPNQVRGVTTSAKNSVDSNFGFQATAKFNDMFSFTGQGLVRKIVTDDFTAELAWAFAKAKISDNFSVRAGRIGLPVYMISEYRSLGYASTMMRPPVEMYSQVPIESMDGADVIYQGAFGETNFSAQLAIGQTEQDFAPGYSGKFTKMSAINLVAEHGPFTFRFGRVDTKINVDNYAALNSVVGGLRAFSANPGLEAAFGLKAAANQLELKDAKGSFTSVGMNLDWKNIIAQAEYGKRKVDRLSIADTSSWYTMIGYRIGKFTPYFNHASVKKDSANTIASLPTAGPFPAQFLAVTNGANIVASNGATQTSNSIGVRWDFYKSAAFKLQLDRFSPEHGSGTFTRAKPGFTGPVTVVAAGIDFVF
ncbi:MAG: hypothetical protein V4447_12380 [Pseudomonadota bacterium]